MNGSQHYLEAERLLNLHADAVTELLAGLNVTIDGDLPDDDPDVAEVIRRADADKFAGIGWMLDAAKSHATLALAAVHALGPIAEWAAEVEDDARAWALATAPTPGQAGS